MRKKRRGRPAIHDEPTESLRVRVSAAQRLDLRRVAEDNGTNMSGVIREAVNEYVSDYRDRRLFRRAPKL